MQNAECRMGNAKCRMWNAVLVGREGWGSGNRILGWAIRQWDVVCLCGIKNETFEKSADIAAEAATPVMQVRISGVNDFNRKPGILIR